MYIYKDFIHYSDQQPQYFPQFKICYEYFELVIQLLVIMLF